MKRSHITGLPIVDEIIVDGMRIPVTCARNYADALADYFKAAGQRPPALILPLKCATKQVAHTAELTKAVTHG